MILTVHDELVFDAPGDEVDELKRIVQNEMETRWRFRSAESGDRIGTQLERSSLMVPRLRTAQITRRRRFAGASRCLGGEWRMGSAGIGEPLARRGRI